MKIAEEVKLAMDDSMKDLVGAIWYALLEAKREHGGNITLDDVVRVIWDERDDPDEVARQIAWRLVVGDWYSVLWASLDDDENERLSRAALDCIRRGQHPATLFAGVGAHQ
jgi:hypothetical protein